MTLLRLGLLTGFQHDLKTEDFSNMSAPLLYEMFKSKSAYPLHLAIRHHREDVVFLFVIEFNSQVSQTLHHMYRPPSIVVSLTV